jgi:hypothetical protein
MDGVGKERNAPGIIHDNDLQDCGNKQPGKRPFYCPDAPFSCKDRGIDNTVQVAMPMAMMIRSMKMAMIVAVIVMVIRVRTHSF